MIVRPYLQCESPYFHGLWCFYLMSTQSYGIAEKGGRFNVEAVSEEEAQHALAFKSKVQWPETCHGLLDHSQQESVADCVWKWVDPALQLIRQQWQVTRVLMWCLHWSFQRFPITLFNDMSPRNITVGCWEPNLNLSLFAQLFEYLVVIF